MLTATEQTIVRLAGQGLSAREIAQKMGFTYGTMRDYLSRLYAKLGLKSFSQLALYAHGKYPARKSGNAPTA